MKKETNETKREPVRNGITELVFVLDRSGSMAGLESDTIGGFNGLLEKQRRVDGKCFVSTVLFDHETLVLHDRLPLEQVENLTDRDYQVRGCTALIDALGGAIRHIGNVHKYARPEDVPESTLFVVITDGLENASKRYTADEVRAMISRQKEKYGWDFLFIGANIDAVQTAKRYGIGADRAVNYRHDAQGTQLVYEAVSDVVRHVRTTAMPVQACWQKKVDEDYQNRK